MGFLDKLQQSAKDTLEKGKDRLEDLQADRKADQLLLDLGKWYYAGRTRSHPEAAAAIERLVAELQAHEAEHGPLGDAGAAPAPDVSDASAAAAPPAAPAPPPPPAPAAEGTAPPAAPSAPVTSGPPPPPA